MRQISFNHVMAVIRYEARILVPQSYLLVGVADEGPAYVKRGYGRDVYTLRKNEIFGEHIQFTTWLVMNYCAQRVYKRIRTLSQCG